MKKTNFSILFLGVMILFSCQMNQKSVGISNWSDDGKVYKWHLGSRMKGNSRKSYDLISIIYEMNIIYT